jgi:hypothetical protein
VSGAEFALSDVEVACGVTLDDVRLARREAYVSASGTYVTIRKGTPPAVAGAAARLALGGPVEFESFDTFGQPFYRLAPNPR